jgi:hypothetical protein
MKKFAFSSLFIVLTSCLYAQDYRMMGTQWGIIGGGYTASLPNRDDVDADGRLDPQSVNFTYAAGIERLTWKNYNFGIGIQAVYWNAGAAYTGFDTLSKFNLEAKTNITYAKLPILFYYRSFNRYKPDRRFRMNTFFGPYFALLMNYKDKVTRSNSELKLSYESTVSMLSATSSSTYDGVTTPTPGTTTYDGLIYKIYDVGFVGGVGAEFRISKKAYLVFNIRTDIGLTNIENNREINIETKLLGTITKSKAKYWDNLYFKHQPKSPLDKTTVLNRPATKNYSLGGFLSFRKFLTKRQEKVIIML